MMEKNHDLKMYACYQFASEVRECINKEYKDAITDSATNDQILKPCKETLLHGYIDDVIMDSITVHLNDAAADDYCGSQVIELCEQYEVKIFTPDEFSKETGDSIFEYNYDYLRDIAYEKLLPKLRVEVFNLLFSDRIALVEFNKTIAKEIQSLKSNEWPAVLKKDGVVKRCTYWPKWLERALFCREKGACAICRTDLSSMLHTGGKMAIDHIVPLALGGTNDTCNLQLLCQKCNLEKSGDQIVTSNYHPTFW